MEVHFESLSVKAEIYVGSRSMSTLINEVRRLFTHPAVTTCNLLYCRTINEGDLLWHVQQVKRSLRHQRCTTSCQVFDSLRCSKRGSKRGFQDDPELFARLSRLIRPST